MQPFVAMLNVNILLKAVFLKALTLHGGGSEWIQVFPNGRIHSSLYRTLYGRQSLSMSVYKRTRCSVAHSMPFQIESQEKIEYELLDRTRVVSASLSFPIWIDKTVIPARVGELTSLLHVGYMVC